MDRAFQIRARWANEFDPPGSSFSWGPSVDSKGAYLVRPPRAFGARYVNMRGRVLRIFSCSINTESGTRALGIFRLKFSWPRKSPGT